MNGRDFTLAATIALVASASAASAEEAASAPGAETSPAEAPPAPTSVATGDATAPPATAPPPRPKAPMPIAIRADGGYSFRRVVDLPLTGADMGVVIGFQPLSYAVIWAATRLMLGSTEAGLAVYTWRLGGDVDFIFDRLRFSPGLNVFIVGVERATRDDTSELLLSLLQRLLNCKSHRILHLAVFVCARPVGSE